MLPWKLQKRQILTVYQNLLSVYFSLAKFQLVSCNLSLAIIWQMTYTQKLPKLCSATLTRSLPSELRALLYERLEEDILHAIYYQKKSRPGINRTTSHNLNLTYVSALKE